MSKILIGCDPEVFIKHTTAGVISGIGLIGGSKSAPRPVEDGTLQEDNVLAEIGIVPAATEDEFVHRVNSVLGQLRTHLKSVHSDLDFLIASSHVMDAEELQHPAALEFGCEPDFNAWTGLMNPRPSAADELLRTAGGHIHIGYDTPADKRDVIKACDVLIGIPSVFKDNDHTRMNLYGGSGAYRPKPYGVEYRTPSNYWLSSDDLKRWIYQQAVKAVAAASDTQFMELVNANESRITRAINRADRDIAADLCHTFSIAV